MISFSLMDLIIASQPCALDVQGCNSNQSLQQLISLVQVSVVKSEISQMSRSGQQPLIELLFQMFYTHLVKDSIILINATRKNS